jgi:transcriptional regulator with XRE-family HTH domain
MILPTLADRAWYAYHCLPRDRNGKPPTFKELEAAEQLPYSTLSHVMSGRRSQQRHETFAKIARALRVTEAWLRGEAAEHGPTLTGEWPPRPGTGGVDPRRRNRRARGPAPMQVVAVATYARYGDVPGWPESVSLAKMDPPIVPPAAYLAGADMPVLRPITRITPAIAVHVSGLAWETLPREMQAKYSTQYARTTSAGHPAKPKPRILRKA